MSIALASPVFFGFCFFVWYVVPPPLSLWLLVAGGYCRNWSTSIFRAEHPLHEPTPGSIDALALTAENFEAAIERLEFIYEKGAGPDIRLQKRQKNNLSAGFRSPKSHCNF